MTRMRGPAGRGDLAGRTPVWGERPERLWGGGRVSPCHLFWPVGGQRLVCPFFPVLASAGLEVVGPEGYGLRKRGL